MLAPLVNWIFGINANPGVFERRINEKKWPIFKFTPNKKKLRKGDNIVFYKAGKDGQKFIGADGIGSKIIPENMDYFVTLYDIQIWKKPIEVPIILNELQFIKNKSNWGMYFQGGVTSLPPKDYKMILSKVSRTQKDDT